MYKVLIADDEPLVLEGLEEKIAWDEYGLEISGRASNGLEALKIIRESEIHILITDIRMPHMSGLELIKHIRDENLNIKCIILSGYNDFDYVREAARLGIENYIMKPLDDRELIPTLLNTISKLENEQSLKIETLEGINILRSNILFRWVVGDIGEDELYERAHILNINIRSEEFLVAFIKVFGRQGGDGDRQQVKKVMLGLAVQNICNMAIDQNSGIAFNDLNGDVVLLFYGDSMERKKSAIVETLSACLNAINGLLKVDVFISAGSISKGFRNLYKSFNHSKKLQDYRLIWGLNKIVYYDELEKHNQKRQPELKVDSSTLLGAVRNRNAAHAVDYIKALFGRMAASSGIMPSDIHNVAIEILFNVFNSIKTLSLNSEKVFDDFAELLLPVYSFETIDTLTQWLCDVITGFVASISSEEEKINPVIRKILDYIQANYAENINLKTVASEFGFNALYLGQLFNKELGISFNSYLNKIRIEKAKEMLLSGMKANEVGIKIGYVNASYFSTIFKRLTGTSPSELKGP